MAYKELTDLSPENTIALGGENKKTKRKNPTKIEGYYLGSRKVDDKKKKSGFSYIHVFQTPTGNVGVWGKTDLDRKILTVTPGTMTLATFDKMVPTPNGEMYKFKVLTDEDNTIEVSGAVGASLGDTEEYGNDTDSYSSGETEDEDDGVEAQEASHGSELAMARRRAEVEALLKQGKNKTKN